MLNIRDFQEIGKKLLPRDRADRPRPLDIEAAKERERQLFRAWEAIWVVASPILRSRNEQQFIARLDEVIENKSVGRACIALKVFMKPVGPPGAASNPFDEDVRRGFELVVGPSAAKRLPAAYDMAALVDRATYLLGAAKRAPISPVIDVLPAVTMDAAFLSDQTVPPAVARGMLGSVQATACLFSLFGGSIRSERANSAIADLLVTKWIESQRQFLVLLASFSESEVSEEAVSKSERLDLMRLQQETGSANAKFRTLIDATK